jgi:hypothetical protein
VVTGGGDASRSLARGGRRLRWSKIDAMVPMCNRFCSGGLALFFFFENQDAHHERMQCVCHGGQLPPLNVLSLCNLLN